ncbi:replication factor-a protein [Sparassis latifolia]
MAHQLTAGFCERINNLTVEDDALYNSKPTVQFLSFKKVPPASGAANANVDRYRIIVSDGEHFLQSMLATQLNYLIEEDQIAKQTIAVIENFTCNVVQDKRLLIILSMQIIAKTADKIGTPIGLQPPAGSPTSNAQTASPAATATPATPAASTSTNPTPAAPAPQPQRQANRAGRAGAIHPIESLSPYQNHWTIKARVTQKTDIKTWSNQRGEGKLFSVILIDETGEIKATGFNAAVDELYDKLQEDHVYYISKGRVNLAKRQYSSLPNEYELTLERNTEVEECHDLTNVPTIRYNFVEIGKLMDVAKDASCDVIGIIKETSPLATLTSKANRTLIKRELTLVDRSGFSVRLTLWGKQAEQFTADDQPVVAFKGVKVGDFGGRSLSMYSSSTMAVNPDIPEAHALRGWYDAAGTEQSYHAYNNMGAGGFSTSKFDPAEILSLSDVKARELGMQDKADSFNARATVMHIKADNIAYPGCTSQDCKKKVVETHDGWRCEKCNKTYEKPEYRYVISMAVADYTGQAWLQGFNDVGEAVFSMKADKLVEIKQRDDAEFNTILQGATGSTFNFVCKAKQDTYNDQVRVRYSVQHITPLNYREEGNHLANLLRRSEWGR